MKKLIAFLIFLPTCCFSQTSGFSQKAKRLIGTFNVYHFYSMDNSEQTSSEIYGLFIENLDDKGTKSIG